MILQEHERESMKLPEFAVGWFNPAPSDGSWDNLPRPSSDEPYIAIQLSQPINGLAKN